MHMMRNTFGGKRNTFDFLPFSSGSRKDRMLRLTSAMLRPNSRYEKSAGKMSENWVDDNEKDVFSLR